MIRRETDAQLINEIANSPAVRPFVDYSGSDRALDLSPAVGRLTETGVVWLSNGRDAVAAFEMTGEREYQAHVFFDETCRGKRAIDTAKEMVAYMMGHADRLWGAIPMKNAAARWFGRQVGFAHDGYDNYAAEGPVEILSKRGAR